jgi:hypothetical protein
VAPAEVYRGSLIRPPRSPLRQIVRTCDYFIVSIIVGTAEANTNTAAVRRLHDRNILSPLRCGYHVFETRLPWQRRIGWRRLLFGKSATEKAVVNPAVQSRARLMSCGCGPAKRTVLRADGIRERGLCVVFDNAAPDFGRPGPKQCYTSDPDDGHILSLCPLGVLIPNTTPQSRPSPRDPTHRCRPKPRWRS